MSSWWAAGSPAWLRPPSWPRRTGRCCCSTASRSSPSAARRTGPWAGCSASTPRSSGGCGSATRPSWPWPTGWAARRSTEPEDFWPRRWAEAYVQFAAGEQRSWLHERGVRWFPLVQWAERGGYTAPGHGNSVPRFHVTWGTGPGTGRAVRRAGAAVPEGADPGAAPGDRDRGRGPTACTCPATCWRAASCPAAYATPDDVGRGVHRVRAGGGRGQRRDRRQLRPGAAELAGRLGRRAARPGLRGAGLRRRRPAAGHRARPEHG